MLFRSSGECFLLAGLEMMRPGSTAPLMPLTSAQLLHAYELPDGWNKCTCQELSICDMLITLQLRRLLSCRCNPRNRSLAGYLSHSLCSHYAIIDLQPLYLQCSTVSPELRPLINGVTRPIRGWVSDQAPSHQSTGI